MEVISPARRYAAKKQALNGNTYEYWLQDYEDKHKRLDEILREKDLLKEILSQREDVATVTRCKSLVEVGFIETFPQSSRGYGLETVSGFYERVANASIDKARVYAQMLNISFEKLTDVYNKVGETLGEEYKKIQYDLKSHI